MPSRTPVRPRQPKRTALQVLDCEVLPRLDKLETKMDQLWPNGDKPMLTAMLADYKKEHDRHSAYTFVWADLRQRFRFLKSPRMLFWTALTALIGALAWKIVSGIKLPPIP